MEKTNQIYTREEKEKLMEVMLSCSEEKELTWGTLLLYIAIVRIGCEQGWVEITNEVESGFLYGFISKGLETLMEVAS